MWHFSGLLNLSVHRHLFKRQQFMRTIWLNFFLFALHGSNVISGKNVIWKNILYFVWRFLQCQFTVAHKCTLNSALFKQVLITFSLLKSSFPISYLFIRNLLSVNFLNICLIYLIKQLPTSLLARTQIKEITNLLV